jgi:predicted nucleic acid-binding protein
LAPTVLAQTILAIEKNTLRAMVAIHIGSAVILKVDVFVSADKRQCEAAVKAKQDCGWSRLFKCLGY